MTKSKPTVKWLDRRISAPGPYMCLCLREEEYVAAMKHLGITQYGPWISTPQADATAHHTCNRKGLAAIICLSGWKGRDPVEVAGLLVHEAVHVWQEWCIHYGEHVPGREQEAYAIQALSQELLAEFSRRVTE
jgi:hypothetical protein